MGRQKSHSTFAGFPCVKSFTIRETSQTSRGDGVRRAFATTLYYTACYIGYIGILILLSHFDIIMRNRKYIASNVRICGANRRKKWT